MTCLLHCIFRGSKSPPPECGERIRIVTAGPLGAAVTGIAEQDRIPDVPRLLEYERAIAALHATRAVIPLRFGCVVEGDSAVLRLLEERQQEYESLLERLDGKVEVGVRLLSPHRPVEASSGLKLLPGDGPGAAYMAALRRRHSQQTPLAPEEEELAATISTSVVGLWASSKREISEIAGARVVSLYFLVDKDQVDPFRTEVLQVRKTVDAKLLVSGPWPPYNFV